MNTEFRFFPYEAMNYKAAQAWLDRKAAQGWGLARIYLGCIARLQRAEQPSHFVDLDIRSGFDGDTDADYLQLCSDAGWELVQSLWGMLLFRSAPGRTPAPIQTDGQLEWERFWKKYRPRIWQTLLIALCIGALAFVWTMPSQRNAAASLATNLGLLYLLYFVLAALYVLGQWVYSRWYFARCRRTSRVEDPGRAATVLDWGGRLQTPLLCMILFLVVAEPLGFGKTVDLEWYSLNETYTATVEACQEWPVVMAVDLDLPSSGYSRRLEGFGSILVDFLEYRELTDGGEPNTHHILTTERYECVSEGLARWVLAHRREETRNGAFLWGELEWASTPGLGFDECYTCRDSSYLLFRQGKVVVLTGCSGTDLTTPQSLESIRTRTGT